MSDLSKKITELLSNECKAAPDMTHGLKNITLIVISFFIICPPAKRAFCKLFKKLAQKSQAAYGRVMITKTIMTVLVFAVSVITLAAEYAA